MSRHEGSFGDREPEFRVGFKTLDEAVRYLEEPHPQRTLRDSDPSDSGKAEPSTHGEWVAQRDLEHRREQIARMESDYRAHEVFGSTAENDGHAAVIDSNTAVQPYIDQTLPNTVSETGKPNPGSEQAVEQGCTCARIDNHYGRGIPTGAGVSFYITGGCPIHDTASETRNVSETGHLHSATEGELQQ